MIPLLLPPLLVAGFILLRAAASVQDGLGTNHVGRLKATSIELDNETRTQWPGRVLSAGGGPWNFRDQGEAIFWTPMILSSGTVHQVHVQTDAGTADVKIVRSHWQDEWGTYDQIGTFTAGTGGANYQAWSSSWVSNGYRLGIAVTNFSTGTNLWWSIEYSQ